jgi:small subunit ribosomal protein S6
MKHYETVIIVDNNHDAGQLMAKATAKLEAVGAQIIKTETWGKKKFAFELNRKQYGEYFAIEFMAPEKSITEIDHEFRITEAVLRFLIYRVTEKQLAQRNKVVVAREEVKA